MEELLLWEFPPKVREWATLLFFWSGVAIWIGLAARFLVPARVVRGPWLTLCLGFVGSCLGPFALRSFFNLERFDPIGPCGLVASIAAAVATLCLFYVVAFFFPPRFDDERFDLEDEEDDEDEDFDNFDDEEERNERRRLKAGKTRRRQDVEREQGGDLRRDRRRERVRRASDAEYDDAGDLSDREAERGRRSRSR